MMKLNLLLKSAPVWGLLAGAALCATARGHVFEDFLPAYADSGMLNVKDFGAKGDGRTDDLPAIKKALEAALGGNGRYSRPPFIYFPAGTYLVSDTIESRVKNSWSNGWRAGMMLMGESRSTVTIRIRDNHPDFRDPANRRAVIKTGSEDPKPDGGGNQAFRHNIFNLTVDVGRGNPGAIGIDYISNNRGAIRNVTIRSSDPQGQGAVGVAMSREWPGPALLRNVRIEGFEVGIETLRHGQYSMTFADIGLINQRKVGILNRQNGLFFENLYSENTVPVIEHQGRNGLITVVNGIFVKGAGGAAITNKGGMVLKNIRIEGYSSIVDNQNGGRTGTVQGPTLEEWISDEAHGPGNGKLLNLPVKVSPEFVSRNPAEWQNAREFFKEGEEDQTAAIQRALDSGKPVVYFPNGSYTVSKTLVIPLTVRKITGLQSAIRPSKSFRGTELLKITGAGEPLVIEHFWFSRGTEKDEPSSRNKVIVHDSSRAVVIRHCDIHGGYENTRNGTGDIFFEDNMGTPLRIKFPQSVWGRQVNCEFLAGEPMISNNGGTIWISGYKTEGQQILLDSKGGQVEIFGVLAYALGKEGQNYDRLPMIRLDRTQAALSIMGNGNAWITVIEDGSTVLKHDQLPRRGRASRVTLYRN